MDAATLTRTAEDEIGALIDQWREATLARDIDRVMACYAPDVLAFDAIGALQFKGRDAYRQHWQACFSQMQGAMTFEISELQITTSQDLAVFHYIARCGGTCDGEEKSGWMRVTGCCRRTRGPWRIVHEHFSSPFDPMTGQVLNVGPA
ncbi:MAG: SgcJ/EcaC family oxidoreductase [Xanthobacteraceae bacterium]|nr:SgcJ/EcaC family oxidoreductase [Xanthobacteraceae bacterium]PWB61437.1 MAG: DUF4440 domain-containing protein [Bradyrhizobiaceae bacterium]GIK80755.1 MAG: hypothetical protein BroJett024_18600 [Alphaproteobacteria bacterium]